MFSLTHSLSQKTFYELKYLNFSSGYNQSLYEIDNVPFKSEIFSGEELESIDLTDSVAIRTGYEIYENINRYIITPNEDGTYNVIDMEDQSGYIADNAFITPAWSFGMGGTQNGRFSRNTSFKQIKLDVSSQINSIHF